MQFASPDIGWPRGRWVLPNIRVVVDHLLRCPLKVTHKLDGWHREPIGTAAAQISRLLLRPLRMQTVKPAADKVVLEDLFPLHFDGDQEEAGPERGLLRDSAGVAYLSDPDVVLPLVAKALAPHGFADNVDRPIS